MSNCSCLKTFVSDSKSVKNLKEGNIIEPVPPFYGQTDGKNVIKMVKPIDKSVFKEFDKQTRLQN